MPLPLVAIVGRPNVGKSTFVNRLAGERTAIVHDEAGVTRDRLYRESEWDGRPFRIIDTGGIVFDDDSEFLPHIRQQAMAALGEAHAAILVVDGQMGPTGSDLEIANWLRQQDVPVFVAVNKCESLDMGAAQAAVFWELGLGEPHPCSAIHGNGVAEILEEVMPALPEMLEEDPVDVLNVAIVGKPNVGKSSLLNRLVGQERTIVSNVPGTTRDAIDTQVEHEGKHYRFVDTAGIRKKSKIDYGVEFFSINRAFRAIERADVVLMVIDATEGIGEQDQKLAGRVADDGRACVVVVNKWDAVEKDNQTIYDYTRYLQERLYFVEWASIVFTSALTGQRVSKIFELVDRAADSHKRRVSTSVVNEVLEEAVMWHSPPTNRQGKSGKIYYGTQASIQPPTFALFVNNPSLFKDNYRRYLEKHFRNTLDFDGTPIRFMWRGKTERAAERGRQKSEQKSQ
ncbi:MAG: ribosome biogenesis GTPase Der [Synechococcus sp.]